MRIRVTVFHAHVFRKLPGLGMGRKDAGSDVMFRDKCVSLCKICRLPTSLSHFDTSKATFFTPLLPLLPTRNMSVYTLLTLLLSSLAAAVPVPESVTPLSPNHRHVFGPLSTSLFDRRAILTPDYWAPSPHFSNMSEYNVTSFAAGATNLAIMRGSPSAMAEGTTANMQEAFSTFTTNWNESVNSLQILYPKGSNAPRNDPQGGTEFYAHPLDLLTARNVSLQYSVYFPSDFDFVKGGKLPGMYGGHKGCSGGNSAVE
jgi:hypothetical protein